MTPYKCIAQGDEAGDCFRTSLAMILNVEPIFVPHFVQQCAGEGERMMDMADEWLGQFGLSIGWSVLNKETPLDELLQSLEHTSPGVPALVSGSTDRGNHTAVAMGNKWYDPAHGVAEGETLLTGPITPPDDELFWVGYVCAANNFKLSAMVRGQKENQ